MRWTPWPCHASPATGSRSRVFDETGNVAHFIEGVSSARAAAHRASPRPSSTIGSLFLLSGRTAARDHLWRPTVAPGATTAEIVQRSSAIRRLLTWIRATSTGPRICVFRAAVRRPARQWVASRPHLRRLRGSVFYSSPFDRFASYCSTFRADGRSGDGGLPFRIYNLAPTRASSTASRSPTPALGAPGRFKPNGTLTYFDKAMTRQSRRQPRCGTVY